MKTTTIRNEPAVTDKTPKATAETWGDAFAYAGRGLGGLALFGALAAATIGVAMFAAQHIGVIAFWLGFGVVGYFMCRAWRLVVAAIVLGVLFAVCGPVVALLVLILLVTIAIATRK